MLVAPLIQPCAPECLLTADRVRAVLDACCYRSSAVALIGEQLLPAGCRIALQFGDQVAINAGGATRLTVRCSVVINGSNEHVSGVTYWQARKVAHVSGMASGLSLTIEADLVLGSGISLEDIRAYGSDFYRHLRLLMADARCTLQELPVHDGPGQGGDVPVLRIEARVLRGLATGRSGLANLGRPGRSVYRSTTRGTTTSQPQMGCTACDWLTGDVLPDLARAVGRVIGQAASSVKYDARAEAVSKRNSHSRSRPNAWPNIQPIAAGQTMNVPVRGPPQ